MKKILDSVHGQIQIPKKWFDKIIDTPNFQRLRRIEQNSCRTVFPSARHDRFIHSIGVYHIGNMIAKHIDEENRKEPFIPNYGYDILKTYKLACLLHDVGHTPFSHTFENYFNRNEIYEELKNELKDNTFENDYKRRKEEPATHELLSACVAIKLFKNELNDKDINWALLVRMIIGIPFTNNNDQQRDNSKFENIMIDLLHGSIDADRLDYVCRDVWAGGYRNYSINLQRLIDAIYIKKNNQNYQLSFSPKALNEIENVLNIKNFQHIYVINHHKVSLEQHYLVEAMKTTAIYHLNNNKERDEALKDLCNFKSFLEEITLPKTRYKLHKPCDDDFIALMKQTPCDDYIKGWLGRKFQHKPLWKSKILFFDYFSNIPFKATPSKIQGKNTTEIVEKIIKYRIDSICGSKCKKHVIERLGLKDEDIIQVRIKSKISKIDPEKILISFDKGNSTKTLSELIHNSFAVTGDSYDFCYWYVNLDKININNDNDNDNDNDNEKRNNDNEKRNKVINEIKNFINTITFEL